MQSGIHPTYHSNTTVTCVCGNTFTTGSVSATIAVDICAKCHPFFTNEMRFVDRKGRIDKFRASQAAAQAFAKKKTDKKQKNKQQETLSFQDILQSSK